MMLDGIYPVGHLLLAIADVWLIGWSLRLWSREKSVAMLVLPAILATMAFDNAVLFAGSYLGGGETLAALSRARFLFHYISVPFLIAVGVELANRAGAGWAIGPVRFGAWILAAGLAVFEIFKNYLGLTLALAPEQFGVLRYALAPGSAVSPPVITIAVNVFLLLVGIGFWVRTESLWNVLIVGTLVSLVGNAIPSAMVGTLLGSASETVLALSLLLTERYTQTQLPTLGIDRSVKLNFIPLAFNWVLIHPEPKGVVYFIGGAGFGTFPTIFYRYILRRLFQGGYTVVALPYRFTLNHWSVATGMVRDARPLRHAIYEEAKRMGYTANLDLYTDPKKFRQGNYFWLGHSLGCKYISLLELLGPVDRLRKLKNITDPAEFDRLLSDLDVCVGNQKRVSEVKQLLREFLQTEGPEYLSLEDQPMVLMAPVITGIEGAIPVKVIADAVKPFIDARPSTEATQCLIGNSESFHFTGIVKFANDRIAAKAGTIDFLRAVFEQKSYNTMFATLPGKHMAPANLSKRNVELGDLLLNWLDQLRDQVEANRAATTNRAEGTVSVDARA
ncbi:MAG: DUF1350 family protein [Synechococcus sp.]